jgi:transposase
LSEWLPDDHLVWTVLGAVDEIDLDAFYGGYRLDGAGRPAYDPRMMIALVLYAYARGDRSSRGIERECLEDVAYKLITTMRIPDHSTIAEFRRRHEIELGELFEEVLGLCREAGLVSVGVIAVDGTKVRANASMDANRSYGQLVRVILREADETDRREDELYGDARGDELPEQLRTAEGRRAALRDAKRRIQERKASAADQAQDEEGDGDREVRDLDLDPERFVTRSWGRRNWFREARRELENQREHERQPVRRDRDERLLDAARRLEENRQTEIAANNAYEKWRVERGATGHRVGGPPKPYEPPELPEGRINTSDPDSRVMRTQGQPPIQGYNAQAAVNENQIIVAAEITVDPPDFGHLEPMVEATLLGLQSAGVGELPQTVVADAGYWHKTQMQSITERGIEVLVPPDGGLREGNRPGWNDGLYALMRGVLSTDRGQEIYRQRKITIEPVFGQIKFNRRIDRFQRRGRSAARSEWRLVAATHNILKLHNHCIANTA